MSDRKQDQAWIENERAENLRRANGVKAIDPGGCAPPVYVGEQSRMDEAVEVASAACMTAIIEATGDDRKWPDEFDTDELNIAGTGMRAALLAALPVLLGDEIGKVSRLPGVTGFGCVVVTLADCPVGTKVYAPSLGEGDGR